MFLLYRNKERWGEHVWMGTAVVRAFSNMPLVMGDIVTIWSSNAYTDIGDLQTILDIFSDLGLVRVFDEEMLNAAIFLITAGPAFLYMLASALCEGAESFLFDPRDAQKLIANVFHGASLMLQEGQKSAVDLVQLAALSYETNLASLHVLEKEGFRSGVIQAMIACSERADEMEK